MGIGWLSSAGSCNVCGVCRFASSSTWAERLAFAKVAVATGDNLVSTDSRFKALFLLTTTTATVTTIMKTVTLTVTAIVIAEEPEIENANNNKITS